MVRIVPRVFVPKHLSSKSPANNKKVVRLAIAFSLKEGEQLPHSDDVANLKADDDSFEDADVPMHIQVVPPHGVMSRGEGVVVFLNVPAEFADRISVSVSTAVAEPARGADGSVEVLDKSKPGDASKNGPLLRFFASALRGFSSESPT